MRFGSGTEDVLQPLVYLIHPISGGYGQCVQKCGCHGYVLAGVGEGGELPPAQSIVAVFPTPNTDLPWCRSASLAFTVARSSASFMFNVIRQGTSSFLLVSYQSRGERCWCSGLL
jgi:hypothetical protein